MYRDHFVLRSIVFCTRIIFSYEIQRSFDLEHFDIFINFYLPLARPTYTRRSCHMDQKFHP
jgi:hypothetical protein